ncbi:hypothetical protein TELCIR_18181 [Teladorsagia circumcincta]|uniref:CHK kinase-like domain-containing protein n=1 Tax=Teladorsagia circumcincta TaxID=45464 RepID=A0A2G9TQW6_TELCI|nr:hypothetical protein TELCIR_18181 [Teladorsagia circumcincta]
MSKILLIDPDWQGKDKELPEKFLAKCHNAEVTTYSHLVKIPEGKLSKPKIAHFGCPATDLVRVFSACLSGKARQEHWEELLGDFYVYLKKEVGNEKMPYTLEQLKESYRRFFPVGAFLIIPLIGPLFECIFRNPDEEMKKKCFATIMEKTECLLDDMIHFHDRNMKIKRGELVG